MMHHGPEHLTASEAAALIASDQLRAAELISACLDRIEGRDGDVRAWAYLDAKAARDEAGRQDGSRLVGPLRGIPFGVKDIINTAGVPTAYGSPVFEKHIPKQDAGCVELLRAAGGIVLGKTVTTEFANRSPGPTTNPHNKAHTPGGSSSGSAAAVASNMVPFALGTQTTGSVIRPASYCGVVGYKPTFGEFDLAGVLPLAPSLDTLGILARSVADVALVRGILSRKPAQTQSHARAARVGLCRSPAWQHAETAAVEALSAVGQKIRQIGVELVDDAELPDRFSALIAAQKIIMEYESARSLAGIYEKHGTRLTAELRALIERGFRTDRSDYEGALSTAARCRAEFDEILGDIDFLLTPSATGEAPIGLQSTGSPIFNAIWTALHTPAITLPLHRGTAGLPVGVQLIGRIGDDDRLLAATEWIMAATEPG